jgi:ATP-dependent DNA ligase
VAEIGAVHARSFRGIVFSEHYSGEGAIFYKHACALGCEGIVSKRIGSPYHAGRGDFSEVRHCA